MQSRKRTSNTTSERAGVEMDEIAVHVGSTPHHLRRETTRVTSSANASMERKPTESQSLPKPLSLFAQQPQPIGKQQFLLGNKDLVIRMLAEIFQVKQDENGQVRWHQVSTSLVPISLYSRTTSKWLDYLLTAPLSIQANDPANTMSPDSRDFLLLLQQFHQQTKPIVNQQHRRQFGERFVNGPAGQFQDAIVFQVVGHDFIDGQCRKILNVKIRQPGTRLGQASDYFVYWKDQAPISTSQNNQSKHFNLHHQQYSASSYASNASFMHQTSSMKQPTNQMLNPIHLTQHYDRQQFQSNNQQTWGLNFASMNDAKLFYDICSLNIVNLDFNSEYLKQLSMCDDRQQKQFVATTTGLSPCSLMANQRRYQQRTRNSAILNQQQQQQRLIKNRTVMKTFKQDILNQESNLPVKPSTRCPSCNAYGLDGQSAMRTHENKHLKGESCPVHGEQQSMTAIRARSRSTTRQPLRTQGDMVKSSRARSFSTPASPESEQCPVHRRRHRTHTECELDGDSRPSLEYLKRSTSKSKSQHQSMDAGKFARNDGGPEKPARGFLRSSYLLETQESFSGRREKQHRQQGVALSHLEAQHGHETSDRLLHSKPNTKTRYMGYLHKVVQQQDGAQQSHGNQLYEGENCSMTANSNFNNNNFDTPEGNRSLFKRIQTGTETFDTFAHRDARVARAQYANSRNMKEFLSLDGGGLQSSFPMDYRFHHKKQTTRQATANLHDGRRNNGQPSSFIAGSSVQRQPANSGTGTQPSKLIEKSGGDKNLPKTITNQPVGWLGSSNVATSERLTLSDTNVCVGLTIAKLDNCALTQCNASTTTEDLPMDSSMKKRMLKLTSEEIISERTEPKSISTSAAVEQAENETIAIGKQEQQLRADRLDLPARAVSLGPELGGDEDRTRGRRARSDAGRRRSLERSVGVDLDSALPASSFMKQARLSPLLQSSAASPQQASDRVSLGCFPEPTTKNSRPRPDDDKTNADMDAICHTQNKQIYGTSHYTQQPRKPLQPLQSDRMLDRNRQALQAELGSNLHNMGRLCCSSKVQIMPYEMRSGNELSQPVFSSDMQQLTIFKSAPDIRQLGDDQAQLEFQGCDVSSSRLGPAVGECNEGTFKHCDKSATIGAQRQQRYFENVRAMNTMNIIGRSNLSSYAVPLCTTVKRPPQQAFVSRRQCHSCPNSLRRKRRPRSENFELAAHEPVMAMDGSDGEATIAYLPGHVINCCSCQHCQRYQLQQQSVHFPCNRLVRPELTAHHDARFACCDSLELPPAFECSDCACVVDQNCHPTHTKQQLLDTHSHRHLGIHHHHHFGHHQVPTGANPCDEPIMGWIRSGHAVGRVGSCPFERQVSRTKSDENFRRDQANQSSRPHSSQSVRSVMQYGLYESDSDDNDGLLSPVRLPLQSDQLVNEHLCQQLHQSFAVRPVQGYDQTMSRACLKSRQRSRSQPPGGDEDNSDGKSAQHLTKSMENVEKLIMEVQNELRALKRQPLGSVNIDVKADSEINQTVSKKTTFTSAAGNQHHQLPVETSKEERDTEARQQHYQDGGQKQSSYSSATRRAGQFKCVGAIRKAGFLLVKKWILKRRQSIELARKQGWKRYWVCLRGTALLFHSVIETKGQENNQNQKQIDLSTWIRANCSSQLNVMAGLLQSENNQVSLSQEAFLNSMSQYLIEEEPRHLIIIDGSIAQPIPEHPRRDFVFCLSTTFGDAYLFQASCQLESDNWISAIHNACAASIARDLVRDEAIKLFKTKIKHFELEADKKSFLRHRLESRLTSMSSMCNFAKPVESNYGNEASDQGTISQRQANDPEIRLAFGKMDNSKKTMRSLLCQLSQQLLALDSYIEQLHCEIYQLRCYLSSCSDQNMFYHNLATNKLFQVAAQHHDLPHPKSLLMHVSKPTKLMLIKLGVFTVSSFHAFIHARQESAKNFLQTIQNQFGHPDSPIVELRMRSRSVSDTLMSRPDNVTLVTETESLIEMADLRSVPIVLSRSLFNKIISKRVSQQHDLFKIDTSDDRYTIQNCDQFIQLNIKLKPSSSSSCIIKQVLKILEPNGDELGFLNYYLQLIIQTDHSDVTSSVEQAKQTDEKKKEGLFVVKKDETLEDWSNYVCIELLEKVVFRVELVRSQMDDDESTAPFGISIEAQLLSSKKGNLLNVYCSYIEWGSVADKAGLKDEDELLMLNSIPVGDLDLMFVECVIQDATKLRALVRSSRREIPPKGKQLDHISWRSLDGDGTADGEKDVLQKDDLPDFNTNSRTIVSQVMTDEYLTSLVCPPPPAKSNAFPRIDTNLLRQKSDLGSDWSKNAYDCELRFEHDNEPKFASDPVPDLLKSRSHHLIDRSSIEAVYIDQSDAKLAQVPGCKTLKKSVDLDKQLKQKTEQVIRLLDNEPPVGSDSFRMSSIGSSPKGSNQNHVERLKKSILELFETEYAYLRHLETIIEHYMDPLCKTSYLNIPDLRNFNQVITDLLKFQHKFFSSLTKETYDQMRAFANNNHISQGSISDDYERFNWIVQQTDSSRSIESFTPQVSSIANIFSSQADNFKIYASYCVAYSKLQKILHPKSSTSATNFRCASTITSIPRSLNTFVNPIESNNLGGFGSFPGQHRDTKLISLSAWSIEAETRTGQLKQLTEFLSNLDSSSSSASFSFQRSSTSEERQRKGQSGNCNKSQSETSSFICSNNRVTNNVPYQRSAHHQNFESYLIKPIQRIVKYPMLLNSIALVVWGRPGETFYNDLQATIKQLQTVINCVNESQRVHDEYGIIFEHIERQFFEQQALDSSKNSIATIFGPHQPPITLNVMQLLYSGPVSWLNISEFAPRTRETSSMNSMLFVFESCVVFICMEQIKVSSKKTYSKIIDEAHPGQSIQNQSSGFTSRVLQWSAGTTSNSSCNSEHIGHIVSYQTLIPVSEVQVRSMSSDRVGKANEATLADVNSMGPLGGGKTTAEFKWELFQCSSSNSNSGLLTKTPSSTKRQQSQQQHRNSNSGKVYLLSCPSNMERNAFLRKIRLTIRESVRNMSLPITTNTKPISSLKSLVDKKLSISSASSTTSNTNISTYTSVTRPDSSGEPNPITEEQSTTIKCDPCDTKKVHETNIRVKT